MRAPQISDLHSRGPLSQSQIHNAQKRGEEDLRFKSVRRGGGDLLSHENVKVFNHLQLRVKQSPTFKSTCTPLLHWSTEAEGSVVRRTSSLEPEVKSSNDFQERGPRSNTQDKTLDPRTNFRANSDGEQRRPKTCKDCCTHRRRLLRALLLQQQRPNSFPSADLSFSSPHYASRCEAALVVRRAAACGSASGEIASGQSVVGQQVRQCLGRSETTVLSRDRYGVRISHCTYTLSIPYLWVPMSFIIGESFFGQISTWKNTILTLCNGFFILKKWTQILPYFEERKKNSKLPHFYVKFQ